MICVLMEQMVLNRSRLQGGGLKIWSWRNLIITLYILLLTRTTSQAEYSFTGEPPSFYYIIEGNSVLLPCAAEVTLDDESTHSISPTILINSVPLNIVSNSPRIFAQLTQGVVVGILFLQAEPSDNGTVLECVVSDGNSTVLSAATQLHVGDGRPLRPLSNPEQTAESLYSITVNWGKAKSPELVPLTHYTIQLVELLEIEREILFNANSNNTNAEVTGLEPGVMYKVYVYGVNELGPGLRSSYVIGMTASPAVPLPPTDINVDIRERGSVCDVILSWTPTPIEPDVMTPITHYVIYYGTDQNTLFNYTTSTPSVTQYNMSGWEEKGVWFVGVASANSAGVSTFSLTPITLEPSTDSSLSPAESTDSNGTPPPSPLNLTTIIAIAGGCFALLLAILSILIVICIVRHRRKRLSQAENSYELPAATNIDELDSSPSNKRRSKSYSPKHDTKHYRESNCSYSMNSDYEREPKRAGSRTPPPDV